MVNNLPAISVEEVAPLAVSDAALFAPEEIKNKPKGDILGKGERTKTDKKRERRKKKIKQKVHAIKKLNMEKSSERPGKLNKKKANTLIEKITKDRNISKVTFLIHILYYYICATKIQTHFYIVLVNRRTIFCYCCLSRNKSGLSTGCVRVELGY